MFHIEAYTFPHRRRSDRYDHRMPNPELTRKLVDVARSFALEVYAQVPEVVRLFLYGSVAAGFPEPGSDIDIYMFYTHTEWSAYRQLRPLLTINHDYGRPRIWYKGYRLGLDSGPLSELRDYAVGENAWLQKFLELPRHAGARLRPFPSVVIAKHSGQ